VNRDTQKFALKCSAIEVNGTWHDVMKDPITDPGKRSKPGRLALVVKNGTMTTVREEVAEVEGLDNLLVPVFKDGVILKDYSFSKIRQNVRKIR
jgi:nicotinamide phosphoribosyltransferase